MPNLDYSDYIDLTPTPQLLQILGDLKFKGWQCIAELVDNSIDAILSSSGLSPEQKIIKVSIPTASKIENNNEPISIEDFADGMDEIKLQNAVKAGYSGKNTRNSIGLFGMGFNVATACLANTVEVWSSTKEMDKEIGVVINLREMAMNKSFLRQKLTRPKRYDKISGTEIKIYDFKKEAKSMLRAKDIVDNLNRLYTERVFNEHRITIKINQHQITPFKFCIWSERVISKINYDDIPAYIEIDQLLNQELFCENCFNWIDTKANTAFKVECPLCHSGDQVVKKDVYLVGWLGIQRYPDPDHFGIDISRNGRILKRLDKSLFDWQDERAKEDHRFHPEYPRDNQLYNGRIVGQIEANFVLPKYTKDDFNADDVNWKDAIRFLRGEMPLQTDLGENFGYKGLNRSPIGNLFRAFRRIDPPGRKTYMFAKIDGSGKSDPVRMKLWRDKFYEGDPKYIDEKTWLEEIDKAELKDFGEPFDPLKPNRKSYYPNEIHITPISQEKFPGKKLLKKTIIVDIENILGEKPFELTLFDYYPDKENNCPIIFQGTGSIGKFNVYINNNHPLFRDFSDDFDELLFMEIASKYAYIKNKPEDWNVSRIYYELKLKYAPEAMLSVATLVSKSNNLMRKIQNRLIGIDGIDLPRKPKLTNNDEKEIKKKYLELEQNTIQNFEIFIMNTKYLKYLDLNYVFTFIEDFPDIVFNKKIINLPYQELDIESKEMQIKKYLGYLNDIRWFMNELSKEGDESIKKLKRQIIRNRYSIDILNERIN